MFMYIGCHLSAAKGYAHMGKDALSIGSPSPFPASHGCRDENYRDCPAAIPDKASKQALLKLQTC